MKKNKYFIYTDASFSHAHSLGVSGYLIFDSKQSQASAVDASGLVQTHIFSEINNIRAEIIGALHVLNVFKNELESKAVNINNIEINFYSDCQTLTHLLDRREKLEATNYISARKKTSLANTDLYKEFYLIYDELHPEIIWIPGHSKKELQTPEQKIFQFVDKKVRTVLRGLVKSKES